MSGVDPLLRKVASSRTLRVGANLSILLWLASCSASDIPGEDAAELPSRGGSRAAASAGSANSAAGRDIGAGGSSNSAAAGASSGGIAATVGGSAAIAGSSPLGSGGQSASSSGGSSTGGGGGTAAGGRGGTGSFGGSASIDPGSDGDGKVEVGPNYTKQRELCPELNCSLPSDARKHPGKSYTLYLSNSKFYTGKDTTLKQQYTIDRRVDVYVPSTYQDGTPAPFLIINDGPGPIDKIKWAVDNLSASKDPARRLPALVLIAVANGGGDGKGSERGLEYDTMSERFASFIQLEVLSAVLSEPKLIADFPKFALTTDPEGHAALGCSSGAAAALTMGWFRPDLFRRLITYSGTFVDQQDDDAPEEKLFPFGAWEYHSNKSLIANSEVKPLRIVINANTRDNGATAPVDGHHNWVEANFRTHLALEAKGYHYRYIVGQDAGHCDARVQDATLVDSLLWVWRGYR